MNVILYPFYPNVFDSYADALVANKQYELAKENYQKAVELAKLKSNRNLEQYEQNLKAFMQEYEQHKNEESLIMETLNKYITGSTGGQPELLKGVFHPNLNLYYIKNNQIATWSGKEYIEDTEEGQSTGERGKILSIDYTNNAAVAKVEISHPDSKNTYIDYFILLKTIGKWSIVHKMFTKTNK